MDFVDSATCRLLRISDTRSKFKSKQCIKSMLTVTITVVVLHLVFAYFCVIAGKTVATKTQTKNSASRPIKLSPDYVEMDKYLLAEDVYNDTDSVGLNLKKALENVRNIKEDVEKIKQTLAQMKNKQLTENDFLGRRYSVNQTQRPTSLLTIFSTWNNDEEKSLIHNNTLKNWASFKPVVNPVLFTNDSALEKKAMESGWKFLRISKTGKNGLPVLKYMYIDAVRSFRSIFYCYANSDILFDDGLVQTLVNLMYEFNNEVLLSKPLLLTGCRWNVINVQRNEISPRKNIKSLIQKNGKVFFVSAEDYFITNGIYPWQDIPEVVVGAIAYDNWLVYNARDKKHLTIDTSGTILALHQSLDENDRRSHVGEDVNYNSDLLKDVYKINIPYHKGFLGCIEKFTTFVNDKFILQYKMVPRQCN